MIKRNLNKLILLCCCSLIVLLSISCDRFNNSFETAEPDTPDSTYVLFVEHLEQFSMTLQNSVLDGDVSPAMTYYSEDYLYDGITKTDLGDYFLNLAQIATNELAVSFSTMDGAPITTEFVLSIVDNSADIDTSWVEYCLGIEEDFAFIGNQLEGAQPSGNRKVLVELFTATWCPNCPYVEAALHDLKSEYGDQFYYVEYHRMDALDFGNADIAGYYNVPASLPIGIIQGSLRISGGSATNSYNEYNYAISQYLGIEAEIFFDNFSYNIQGEQLTFSLSLFTQESLPLNDLVLRYAYAEKVTEVDNYAGEPCRNVVLTEGSIDIQSDNINDSISGTFTIPEFETTQPQLVVWVQTMNNPYNSETSIVHNVEEYSIIR
jgi:thiol-disulfide isomerase/thioredoxin